MPKEKDPHHGEKPKRRRRGAPAALILLLLLVIIIALLIIFKPFGGNGFGLGGNGSDGSSGDGQSSSVSDSVPESDSSQPSVAVIKIDGNDIFLDGEQCENAAALKEKITVIANTKDYELDHSAAIKSTYDEVKQVLSELENALNITVNYNE